MKHLSSSQASQKIKEARKKTSYWMACLFALVCFLLPTISQAATKDIDLVEAYYLLFPAEAKKLKAKAPAVRRSPTKKQVKMVAKKKPVIAKPRIQKAKPTIKRAVFAKPNKKKVAAIPHPLAEEKQASQPNKVTDLNALFAKAFGKKAVSASPSKVSVELRISKTVIGDVTVYSNKQGILDSVGTEEFFPLLKDIVKAHVYNKVEKSTSKKKKLPFNSLSQHGIEASYNSVELSLDLNIKSELRKPLILSMHSTRKTSVRDENKITAKEASGFLNMYSNLGLNSGGSKPLLNLKFEGSLNIGKTVFESTVDVRDGKFSSDKIRLTYDVPDKLQRFVLGDISTGARNYQENLRLNGLRISKEFFMNPELQIRPKANESFVLESDSEVEVFINNQLRQRFHLRAGIYSLQDIGLYDGANNIRVRIKDEFGKVSEKTSQQFYASQLLEKDLSLYAISVGYLSKQQAGANNDLIKDPLLSGYYQKGITKDLTMGVDAQISANSYLLGSEMITSAPLGIIKSSVALSGGSGKGSGAAAHFEFRPNKKMNISLGSQEKGLNKLLPSNNEFFKNWTLAGELRSRDFSLLNGSDSIDAASGAKLNKKLKARLQTNVGLNFGSKWQGGLNLALSDYYDADQNASVNLTASRRFLNSINLSVAARYDSDNDFSVNMQLSIPLSNISKRNKTSLDLRADSRNNSFESKLSLRPHSLVGRNSLEGSLEYVQNDDATQQVLNVGYRATNYETSFKAQNSHTKVGGQNSQQLNIGFNSSLACVGKECAVSNPIHDSFALVSGPSNQTSPIAINNSNSRFIYSDTNDSGLPDNYTALIAKKNTKAVIGLDSYRYQSINIAESTLPDGYDPEKTEFEVFPRYHQGFMVKAGGEPATILNGILVDQENKPLGFKGGQWVPEDSKGKTIAFFSNKVGRFRVTSILAGKYKLELFDYPDMQAIDVVVPDLKGKVHDLGNLQIVE